MKLASITLDNENNTRGDIELIDGRLICANNDITPQPENYNNPADALRDIIAMYSNPVWRLETY